MNPLALYLASGESLYVGAILLLALILLPQPAHPWLLRLRMLVLWSALALMAMACPPFPPWLDFLFLAAFLAWLITAGNRSVSKAHPRARGFSTLALALLTVLLPALELPHRMPPVITAAPADHLVVIGDSISSGISKEPPWPQLLQQQLQVPVKNLSTPGAQVDDSLAAANKLSPADTLVLLEVGGNDLIAGVNSADFERRLAALFQKTAAPGRTVLMFELPLLPHRIAYGRIQRRLAAEYHVTLIPKRLLIQILATPGATSDGLHLSPTGAHAMAELVASVLRPVLIRP